MHKYLYRLWNPREGLDGYIIVEANGVLLISKKDEEQRVKQFSKAL